MTALQAAMNLGVLALVILMTWSLWNLSNSPLHSVQRLWWVFAVLILPGIGSLAWMWWIKRYYPQRKAQDPQWDPATTHHTSLAQRRPRPSRGKYTQPGDR